MAINQVSYRDCFIADMCAVLEAVFSVKMPMLLNNSQSYAKALCSHEDVNEVPVSSMCSGIMGQRCHVIMKYMEERRANEPSLASCMLVGM